jgi:hypothetical protein
MNLEDIFAKDADRLSKQIAASYSGKSPWTDLPTHLFLRYQIREMFSSSMGKRGLYEMANNGAKFLHGDERVRPDEPGGFVYGIWDRDEMKLLSVWPNKKLAENVLRLMQ